ncbi:MAG: BON domain-containing protein, partial [Thermomicrobiaceae bacterium]|nr:BON domain-containing protein [Thermomicrobiaceae bacterium]
VEDRAQKRLAGDVAESVPGVRDVHNRLRLRRTGGRTDQRPR